MRRFYSLLLTAAFLLVGMNLWAQTKVARVEETGVEYSSLQAAINAVGAGQTATITLLDNVTLSAPVVIPQVATAATDAEKVVNRSMQHITLDLDVYNISSNSSYFGSLFILLKGELNITGEGSINRNDASTDNDNWAGSWGNFSKAAVVVCGADGDKNNSANDRSKQVWSVLNIGPKVTINGAGHKNNGKEGGFGIAIQDITDGTTYGNNSTYHSSLDQYIHYANLGYRTFNSVYNTDATYDPMWFRSNMGLAKNREQGSAFGVKIMIEGTVWGYQRGINIVGHINQHPDTVKNSAFYTGETLPRAAEYPFYTHYYPYIKIAKDAKVYCSDNGLTSGNGGIYGGGWAIVDIYGEVYGQTGVYLKGGDVLVYDGIVRSTSENGSANGDYKGNVSGNAIFVTTDAAYAGNTNLTIDGDSKITGNGGTAITEVLASNSSTSTVQNINIQGGTIEGGNAGAIAVTESGAGKTTIMGGGINTPTGDKFVTVNGVDVGVGAVTDKDVHSTTVVVDGKTTVVVSKGAAPTESAVIYGAAKQDSVKWTGTAETLAGDLTLKELEINQNYAQTLTVPNGITLTSEHVVLGAKAKIIVKAGGKFIVTGKQGLAAFQEGNLVLENAPGNRSIFLFHPKGTSNKHPKATYELLSNSWRDTSKDPIAQSEVFGIPTHNAITGIACKEDGKYAYIQGFMNGGWKNIAFTDDDPFPYDKLDQPFAAYAVTSYRTETEDPLTIQLSGELVGNDNATLTASWKWNFFANSYTAEVDLLAFLNGLETNAQNVDHTVYVLTSQGNGYLYWKAVDAQSILDHDPVPTKLQPLQGFLLNNTGSHVEDNTINYETMVYMPAVPSYNPSAASRRNTVATEYTAKMFVDVTSDNGSKDNVILRETVNAKSVEKYMNDDINIYATTEEKSAILAAENLEDTYVGFSTVKGGNFTISFANVVGREFDLLDLETGARVAASEGETYSFSAAANSANDYRFKLVAPAKMPTAIENTEVKASAKGIFTLTGQFLGEMNVWNTLPAGVYVVNGAKRVK